MPALENRNITAANGRRTSARLEPEFWRAAERVCHLRGITLLELVAEAESAQGGAGSRTSAIRTFILQDLLARTPLPRRTERHE